MWAGCCSEALAVAALHEEAYIFVKAGQDWNPYSVWQVIEYPTLTMEGGKVNRIYRVDPRLAAEGGRPCPERKLIWERGKNAAVSFNERIRCKVTEDN